MDKQLFSNRRPPVETQALALRAFPALMLKVYRGLPELAFNLHTGKKSFLISSAAETYHAVLFVSSLLIQADRKCFVRLRKNWRHRWDERENEW